MLWGYASTWFLLFLSFFLVQINTYLLSHLILQVHNRPQIGIGATTLIMFYIEILTHSLTYTFWTHVFFVYIIKAKPNHMSFIFSCSFKTSNHIKPTYLIFLWIYLERKIVIKIATIPKVQPLILIDDSNPPSWKVIHHSCIRVWGKIYVSSWSKDEHIILVSVHH